MIQLVDHFASDERTRHSEWLRQRQWFFKAQHDHTRKEEIAEKLEGDLVALAADTVIATQTQIREFNIRMDAYESRLDAYDARLDKYDEAVTKALIESIERLDILKARHTDLLDNGFITEDGLKVFRSEDGTYAVDENGQRLDESLINPKDIPDGFTSAEEIFSSLEDMQIEANNISSLHKAHADINAKHEKSALAREKLEQGREIADEDDVSVDALSDIEAEIEAAMLEQLPTLPASALKHLSGLDSADSAPNLKSGFSASSGPKDAVTVAVPAFQPESM